MAPSFFESPFQGLTFPRHSSRSKNQKAMSGRVDFESGDVSAPQLQSPSLVSGF